MTAPFLVRQHGLTNQATMWLVIGALAGGELGTKLSMLVFLGPELFFRHLPELVRTGMSYTGALIGGYIGVRLMERKAGIRCRCDLFALPLARSRGWPLRQLPGSRSA